MTTRIPSIHEVGTRARQAGTAWLEQLGVRPSVDPSTTQGVRPRAPVQGAPMEPAQFASQWPEHIRQLTAQAERVLGGRFDLLGYRDLVLGNPPDWHADPLTGQRAGLDHWRRIPYLDAATVGDHKRVWELNRHDHLVLLAQAYQVSGDPRFAASIATQFDDWLRQNPPKRGINWVSSLELGFRIINWIWTIHWTGDGIPDALRARVVASLEEQVLHIERYLSLYFSPNTHLTGEALALLYAGVTLPTLPHAARWRATGLGLLQQELCRQFHEDGVYFEQTTWYQRYCCDFYLHATLVARTGGLPLPADWTRRVNLMVDALLHATHPDGSLPLVGDDDGGALLPLSRTSSASAWDTLALAAITLERRDCAALVGSPAPIVGWVAGGPGVTQWRAWGEPHLPPATRAFRAGGWYSMRSDWGKEAFHLLCDAGPHGGLTGAHAHADALSFVLSTHGRQVLTDPGTYTYVGPERDEFRGTAMHCTVVVAAEGSAAPAGPFRWLRTAHSTVHEWYSHPAVDYLDAEHDGFHRLSPEATHGRAILWRKGAYVIVLDQVRSSATYPWQAHYPAAAGMRIAAAPGMAAIEHNGERFLSVHWPAGDLAGVEPTWVSPAYGVRVPGERLVLAPADGSDALLTVLDPEATGSSVLSVRRLEAAGGVAWEIESGAWLDVVAVARGTAVEARGLRSTARLLWCRRSRATGQVQECLLGGGGSITFDGAALFHADATRWFQRPAAEG